MSTHYHAYPYKGTALYLVYFQIDFGSVQPGVDRAPYEDLISKQPLSIAYLRQYLRPSALWVDKQTNS